MATRKLVSYFGGRFQSNQNKRDADAAAMKWAGTTIAHMERQIRAHTEHGYICLMRPDSGGGYRYWFQTPSGQERAVCYCHCGPTYTAKTEEQLWAQTLAFFRDWVAGEMREQAAA